MRNGDNQHKLMVDGEIVDNDGPTWSDSERDIRVSITPDRGCEIRIPLFIFKARLLLDPCNGTSFTEGI